MPTQRGSLYQQFAGTWQLVAFIGRSPDGEVFTPYGQHPAGQIMYDPQGYMAVVVMDPDRPRFASGDVFDSSAEEARAGFLGFEAYCGTYSVDEDRRTITHQLTASRFPNWAGTAQLRHIRLEGSRLTLSTDLVHLRGKDWIMEAQWVRAPEQREG